MAIALVATAFFLPATPPAARRTSLADPFRALRYPGLLTIALTALFYNMGFFTLLAFTPFPLDMTASQVGWIFFGWGLLLADHLGVGRADAAAAVRLGARPCSAP